jgi:tRNA(Ile)-lysidine synthase
MPILKQVKAYLAEQRLVADGEKVLVALSGGPDSVALLHLLCRLRKSHRLYLSAVYINHQIRPRSAAKEERFCDQLCDRLDVGFIPIREDIPTLAKKRRVSLEEAARDFRYETFHRLAGEHGFDRVALGHHADDQVETILFRLFRGTGPYGLTGIPANRGRIIRPLLEISKADILSYLKRHKLDFCRDRSNASVRFSRNFIRNRILPILRERLNPKVESAILSLADILSEDEAFIEELVDSAAAKCLRVSPGGKFNLDLSLFGGYSSAIRRRLLRRCLKATCQGGQFPDRATVEQIEGLARKVSGSVSLPGQVQADVIAGRLWIYSRSGPKTESAFEPGRRLELDWPSIRLTGRLTDRSKVEIPSGPRPLRAVLDWSAIRPPLAVRTIRPGDRFRPLGMIGHKKIGDFLTDHKIPRPLRNETLLLCDSEGILWVVGHEIAERAKVVKNTEKVLSLAVSIRKKANRSAVRVTSRPG